MTKRSIASSLVATIALVSSAVLGGASAASAVDDCGSATVNSVQECSVDWLAQFDPHPSASESSNASAVAVSGDGKTVIWAYEVTNSGSSAIELKRGRFTSTGISWTQGTLTNVYTYGEDVESDMSIALSVDGTRGGLQFVTSGGGNSHVRSIPFTYVDDEFVLLDGNNQRFNSDDIANADFSIVRPKASIARDGSKVLFTYGTRDGASWTSGTSNFVEYVFADGYHGDPVTTDWLSTDAGLSADGSTVWAVGVDTRWSTPYVTMTYCRTTLSLACLETNWWHIADEQEFYDARGAVDDKGKELAMTVSKIASLGRPGPTVSSWATSVPLINLGDFTSQFAPLPVNIHPLVGEFSWTQDGVAPAVSIDAAGTRMYVGSQSGFGGSVLSSAKVTRFVTDWALPTSAYAFLGDMRDGRSALLVGRNGSILRAALTTDNVLRTTTGHIAYGSDEWSGGSIEAVISDDAITASHISMSDDGQYYAVSVDVPDDHPVVLVGKLLKHNLVVTAPKVSGTYKVGKTLSVTPGKWTKSRAGATASSYQWLRNGSAIPGATKSTYKLVAADKNRSVTVEVAHTYTGYYDRYATYGALTLVR